MKRADFYKLSPTAQKEHQRREKNGRAQRYRNNHKAVDEDVVRLQRLRAWQPPPHT